MAMAAVQQQILRFLASEAPEVMAIKGAWGVGKTYAWNAFLTTAKQQHKIAFERYSYVSLFGINSLDDLRFAIFENLVERNFIGRRPSIDSFKSNTAELLKSLGKKTLPLLPSSSTEEHYRSMIDSLAFLSLERVLICIDDFERKGKDIDAQDIMGLITQLKEQKRCKIVLILNDESLNEDSTVDYVKLREKVIDSELCFAPSAEDCVAIALTGGRIGTLLRENVLKLKIRNIRIIKKIERLSTQVLPLLKKYDDEVLHRALRTLTLLTWSYYCKTEAAPDYDFVLGRTNAFSDLDDSLPQSIQQQEWAALLRRYDNYTVDDFDLQLARLVENGYIDELRLLEEAERFNDRILAARTEGSFQDAWRMFNESFDDNVQEVIDGVAASFRHNVRFISPANLDGAVRLLRFLGKDSLATKIINLYIEKRRDERELFNLDTAVLAGQIRDQEVIDRFREQQRSFCEKRPLQELCDHLLAVDSCSDDEEQLLAEATVEEYIALFKAQKGPQLSRYVDLCLKFSRLGGTTDYQEEIVARATEALRQIGAESPLNAARVRRFGIKID
ncbi:MAG: hypothetical protein C0622_03265 [Desulfuromonas sp.]|nr:MAG: hypothetical protein C0622_03265 [Desulfuromonas sp.]